MTQTIETKEQDLEQDLNLSIMQVQLNHLLVNKIKDRSIRVSDYDYQISELQLNEVVKEITTSFIKAIQKNQKQQIPSIWQTIKNRF